MIIVALGNPGKKFENTRHNAGFMAIDFFAKKNDFPEFTISKKHEALISEQDNITLAKPQTFMNESGRTVKTLTTNYKLQTTNLVIVHDDIDLPLGKIKFSKDSGSGGHKGVDSIIQHLGNNHFIQLKIGVATTEAKAEEVVLQKFTKEEQKILQEIIEKSAEALQCLIENGLEKTMNQYH